MATRKKKEAFNTGEFVGKAAGSLAGGQLAAQGMAKLFPGMNRKMKAGAFILTGAIMQGLGQAMKISILEGTGSGFHSVAGVELTDSIVPGITNPKISGIEDELSEIEDFDIAGHESNAVAGHESEAVAGHESNAVAGYDDFLD